MTEIKHKISEEKVWLKHYPETVSPEDLPKRTAYGFLKEVNMNNLHNAALQYYGTTITYGQFFEIIDETAEAFAAQGVKEGDIVSFVSVSVPECVASVYALNKLGATANTIDPRMDIDSIRRMVKESGSRILVTIDLAFPKIKAIMKDIDQDLIITQSAARSLPFIKKVAMKLSTKTKIDYNDKIIDWDTFLQKGAGTTAVEAPYVGDRAVVITYTGGTTGFPKGVLLTNDSMNAVAFNFLHASIVKEEGDRFLGIIPIFTSYGVVVGTHMPLTQGIELVLVPKFDPTKFGSLVKKYRPNHMISTPAFYEMLMNSKEMKNIDLSFIITLGSGGDTMNEGLSEKLQQFMKDHNIKYPLAQGYGMSEVSAAASFCVNDRFKEKSVGIPSLTTTISIFDTETMEEKGYNEMGEICITGPTVMKGYFNRDAETAHVIRLHDDGQMWVHSGDIGYMDEDGFLFIKGRVKRMITRFDGHKVFPINIESLVAEHEHVRNCCAVGINDRGHGQGHYPLVLVELSDEVEDSKKVCREIYDECLEKLEERGQPVAVIQIDKIPLTGVGKNDYRTLEDEYEDFNYVGVMDRK